MTQILLGVTCVAGHSLSGEHSCFGANTQVLTGIMEVLLVTKLAGGGDQHHSRRLVATCGYVWLSLVLPRVLTLPASLTVDVSVCQLRVCKPPPAHCCWNQLLEFLSDSGSI